MRYYEGIDDNGRKVKCRKRKQCEWCNEWIKIGETAVVRVYKFEDVFNSEKMHLECYEAFNRSIDEQNWFGEYEFDGGMNYRGQSELESEEQALKGK